MVSFDRCVDSRAELVKQVLTGVNKRVCDTFRWGNTFILDFLSPGRRTENGRPPPRAMSKRMRRGNYCASLLCLSALTLMMKFLAE